MILPRHLHASVFVSLMTLASTAAFADERACSAATLKGAYGILLQGTRPAAPGAPAEEVIGVVIRHYDGTGTFTQIDTVKGLVTGAQPDRSGNGTYQVNPDCTGATQTQPGPGIALEERIVVVDRGHTVLSMTLSPPPLMVTTVQHRVGFR